MCGIAGIAGPAASVEVAEKMRSRLIHRGPDDKGLYIDGAVTLSHTRLCVLDPSDAGRQPMCTADDRYALVYNGEVYNFSEIREVLQDRGHQFCSQTDTEVVLYAWAEWGAGALDRLEGMYAFAVWDSRDQVLHLVRDRLGIKPLYWHYDGSRTFIFASEIRALLASGHIDRRLDRSVLATYLSQQTAPTPKTLVEGVRMLPAGTVAEIRIQGGRASPPKLHQYWHPLAEANERRPELAVRERSDLIAGLRTRLEVAVEHRLVADVPLGAFLSGGVDSTIVVALMAELAEGSVNTFTVVFEDGGEDDGPYARHAADWIGTDHHEVSISGEELVEQVPQAVAAQDHPSGDGINTWLVSRAARASGVTVALSGLGGDELFGGYPSFRRLQMLDRASRLIPLLPAPVRQAIGRALDGMRPGGTGRKLTDLLTTDGSVAEAYPVLRQLFDTDHAKAVTISGQNEEALELVRDRLRDDFTAHPRVPLLARVSHAELTTYMADVLLRDTDQMSMSHSLEIRVPLLDRELVEYSLALPEEARRPATPPKQWLVDAAGDLLPRLVAHRAKSGFSLPFEQWMRGPLKEFCGVGVKEVAAHPAFCSQSVLDVWDDYLEGGLVWSRPWLLVALGHWLNREQVG